MSAPGPKKPRKVAVKAVSTKPKRPLTPFFIYLIENRDRIKSSRPGIAFTQISVVASEEWKKLKPAQKAPFEKRSQTDKARYEREMATYIPGPEEKKKRRKDPDAPKKAKTAYNFFVQQRSDQLRQKHPDKPMNEIMKLIGAEWRGLSDREKQPFQRMAAENQ